MTSRPDAPPGRLARSRGAVGYLTASIPLRLASSGSAVVIPILAVQELDDVGLGGLLVAASLAPSVLVAPFVGVVLDRTRRPRRWMIASGLVTALAFTLTAFLGEVPTALVAVALIAAGCATPFFMGGLSAFVAEAVGGSETRAYAADALSYNIGGVAGPGLAALAIAAGSARAATVALAVAAVVGAVACLALRLEPHPTAVEPRGVLHDIAAGARFLVTHRPLALVTLSGTIAMLGAGALPIAAIAVSVQRSGSTEQAAWIVTAFEVGGLVGAVLTAARPPERRPAWLVMTVGFAATGLATVAAALDAGLPFTLVAIAVSGALTAPGTAAMLLLRKQQSPRRVRSQVFTVAAGLRATASAVGAAIAGGIAGLDGGVLVALVGVSWIAAAAVMLAYPRGAEPVDGPAVVV